MGLKLNLVMVIMVVSIGNCVTDKQEKCENAKDCKSCLLTVGLNEVCKWCADPDYNKRSFQKARCNTFEKLNETGCNESMIVIQDGASFSASTRFVNLTQVIPKNVTLSLRPGHQQTFQVHVKPARDNPVRLYYLMDMSGSMSDDKKKLQTLGTEIAHEIKKITKDFKLAFGTFVDKSVIPFISGDAAKTTFGYRHVFNFNADATKFNEAVKQQNISENMDIPEGGFDALMQIAVCGNTIWPKEDLSRKIVVYVTDATPHIAGDGKIGGILVPNDGKCYLEIEKVGKEPRIYTKTKEMDYPSISHLGIKLKENGIVPILAVTQDVKSVYKDLQKQWKNLGTGLGELKEDSSNIVKLIRDSYKEISTTVHLSDNAEENLDVTYKVIRNCTLPTKGNECKNVQTGQEVVFNVTVTANTCPANWRNGGNFKITVPGFGTVLVDVAYICECKCDNKNATTWEEHSTKCNRTGTFKCGMCHCDEGRFGKHCECGSAEQANDTMCIMPNKTERAICSHFGNCVCGKCECDEKKRRYGKYCECDDFHCDRYNNATCGGEERGKCKCGECDCKDGFEGYNCGNCTRGSQMCIKEGKECSGHGECVIDNRNCGKCHCFDERDYKGKYCEKCIFCPQRCHKEEKCVLCQAPYNKGRKECTKASCGNGTNVEMVNSTNDVHCQRLCSVYLNQTCRVWFCLHNDTVYVEEKPRCIDIRKVDAPIMIIVLGIIGGIVLLCLLFLLIGKLSVTAYDEYEFLKFQKNVQNTQMQAEDNPIFEGPIKNFENPAYAGNK